MTENLLLLYLTVTLGAGRNILSRHISCTAFGSRLFFFLQSCIFAMGGLVLMLFGATCPANMTVLFSCAYALLLLIAQWCYTAALGRIPVSICSTVYSLGFILPTLSGVLFWHEAFTIMNALGLALAIGAIAMSRQKSSVSASTLKQGRQAYTALLAAMLASGGLGIIQKLQQASPWRDERSIFVIMAFLMAALVSAICAFFSKANKRQVQLDKAIPACLVGVCFGLCNLLNTTLAGRLPSAIFFPVLNIGVMMLSAILGIVICKERVTVKNLIVFALGIGAILLLA